jgi:signal transduction histidine kinase
VLLDLGLPDSQGKDSALKVRNLNPDLALVVLTGLNDERVAVEALQSGAQDYLIKGDYQPGQLGRSLRYAIERKQAEIALRDARLNEEVEREAERQRIAMDLHDGVIQDIYGVALSLETMLGDTSSNALRFGQAIERCIEQLHEVLVDIRRYIFELRPERFTGNLEADLRHLAQQFEAGSEIRTSVSAAQELPHLDGAAGVALFHIAHEALSNARKHASPSQITLSATGTSDVLVLEVTDDGAGFDTATLLPEQHRGLRNMAARAASIGAELLISSSPGQGTSIRI